MFDDGAGLTVEFNWSADDGPMFVAYKDGVAIASFAHLHNVSEWLDANVPSPVGDDSARAGRHLYLLTPDDMTQPTSLDVLSRGQ